MRKKILFRVSSMEMREEQKVLLNIIDLLDRKKFEPIILLDLHQGELLKYIPLDIQVSNIVKGKQDLSPFSILKIFQLVKRHIILIAYQLSPKLLKNKIGITPDIEIAMTHFSLSGLVNSPFQHSKKINWFHSDIRFFPLSVGKRILSMMKRCDLTVFTSNMTKINFENHLGKTTVSNSMCIYNTVNTQKIRKQSLEAIEEKDNIVMSGKNTFLSIGQLVYQKGYDLLLQAHVELIKEGVNHHIVIIGDGYGYSTLKKKIKLLGVQNSFFLLGNRANPYPYMVRAPYYIQPSRYESLSSFVREAMIFNKPVISTKCVGAQELIPPNTGIIVDCSKHRIKKAIKTFLFDPTLVSRIKMKQKEIDFERENQFAFQQIESILK